MTTGSRHYKEELHELLDERLSSESRVEVEKHLEVCLECSRELEALRWTRQSSAAHREDVVVPEELRSKITGALDREDSGAVSLDRRWWQKPVWAYALLAVVGALAVLYFFLRPDLPLEVTRDYQSFKTSRLPLQFTTSDVKQMEQFFSSAGIPFPTRVFDLGMMNYRLVGGRVHQLNKQKSALFVYQGENGKSLLCQMYQGTTSDLPRQAEIRENNGIRFHIYQRRGLTLVFWQEGAVTCVLVSDINREEVIQLAFAKAMKV